MKGLVFAGCSFTWGEGLELYSDLNTINWNSIKNFTYRFDDLVYFMPKSHKRYIESNRFSRIISNYFETFDLVDDKNGGNHFTMLSHIKKCSDFIIDNYIPIIYKNSKYKSFLELLNNNSELIIKSDFSFTENYHPNKKCHKVISDSIIEYLK